MPLKPDTPLQMYAAIVVSEDELRGTHPLDRRELFMGRDAQAVLDIATRAARHRAEGNPGMTFAVLDMTAEVRIVLASKVTVESLA